MQNYPFGTWKLNARLGKVKKFVSKAIPDRYSGLQKLFGLTADAIVIWKGKVTIIECVVRPGEYYKIQQLNTYERAFRVTEEYRKYWDWPIEKIILTTETDEFMESEAKRSGIRVIKWTTPDIEAYKAGLYKRQITPRGSGLEPLK